MSTISAMQAARMGVQDAQAHRAPTPPATNAAAYVAAYEDAVSRPAATDSDLATVRWFD